MLDCIGSLGVKRPKAAHRGHIPGVIGYCRKVFEQQVPFDYEFRPDDAALYCVEPTEKAFRSQGLALSEPVRIGDWEHLMSYPLTALGIPLVSQLMVEHAITLEQAVYLPGNEQQGEWASPLLETVFGPDLMPGWEASLGTDRRVGLRGDFGIAVFAAGELHRSYSELTIRWFCDLALHSWVQDLLAARGPDVRRASLDDW